MADPRLLWLAEGLQPELTNRILDYLGVWTPQAPAQLLGPTGHVRNISETVQVELELRRKFQQLNAC